MCIRDRSTQSTWEKIEGKEEPTARYPRKEQHIKAKHHNLLIQMYTRFVLITVLLLVSIDFNNAQDYSTQCDLSCLTCSGPLPSQCTSCDTGNYLNGGRCLPCDGSCRSCSGKPKNCTSCQYGLILNHDFKCCHKSCYECTGPEANKCITCRDLTYSISNGTCLKCKKPCKTCEKFRNTVCTSCGPDRILTNRGQCCPPFCEICTEDRCTLCIDGYNVEADGTCLPSENGLLLQTSFLAFIFLVASFIWYQKVRGFC
eukprot:TRINITY_DN23302_c0_g1_i1.p3 TRINITY_DN23302_c0_g1~~TRINITY_DN23302_c0_g1_i1.p3  ORF type:complete len:257 (+),score=79.58 TRINITY_DN23302_c0_g1_i1:66-836(+)